MSYPLLALEHGVEPLHGLKMPDGRELRRGRPADALGRRGRDDEFGVLLLERDELAVEPVVLGVPRG